MQRIGIIDLGSNTTRLMVMSLEPNCCIKLIDEVSEVVRLVEGQRNGILQPAPMQRAIEALAMFHTLCHNTNVRVVIAVATSAVREATNRQQFLDVIKQKTGLELRILQGDEEGYYGYLGVINSLSIANGYVIDIGGGSTEVSEIYERSFSRAFSHPIGIVRLTEQCVQSDPISKGDVRAMEDAVATAFADLSWLASAPGYCLVGVGGTVRNLARMAQKRTRHPLGRVHGFILTAHMLDTLITVLRRSTIEERKSLPGLNRDRADVILAGAIILRHLMQKGDFDQLQVSGEGLREGLFYEYVLREQPKPRIDNVRLFNVENLARLHHYEERHAHTVRDLSLSLFDQLRSLHGYGAWERELLSYAALLHDIGVQVGYYDHHKHSAYLVIHSALRGFDHREIALLALLVRLHRKGSVDIREYRQVLAADDEQRVARLSALLRIAEYLERSKSQVVYDLRVVIEVKGVRVEVLSHHAATVEIWDANRRANLFRTAYGCDIEIVAA